MKSWALSEVCQTWRGMATGLSEKSVGTLAIWTGGAEELRGGSRSGFVNEPNQALRLIPTT